jgi:FAD synthase
LVNGVYYGDFYFITNTVTSANILKKYKGVLSIGYNPYFDNDFKTIEVFLIDYEGDDFYGEDVMVTIKGYIRPESAFENFCELVTAITYDIIIANKILSKDEDANKILDKSI